LEKGIHILFRFEHRRGLVWQPEVIVGDAEITRAQAHLTGQGMHLPRRAVGVGSAALELPHESAELVGLNP
jgi:hypothetical protein